MQNYRGRGGRGRGNRGGYGESRGGYGESRGGSRGGRGRGARPQTTAGYVEKSEFEGEDDDQMYTVPTRV